MPAVGRKLPKELPRWRVTRIAGAKEICERQAKSADEAIKPLLTVIRADEDEFLRQGYA